MKGEPAMIDGIRWVAEEKRWYLYILMEDEWVYVDKYKIWEAAYKAKRKKEKELKV